ncbi:hypothetical protein VC83_08821 [Pseudogymnoascus destructans]|uniref:Methyltransferase domain-containing protein n=2 Tax=Pseudogymnoascus destructans TaxID=655981 RepID=L8FPQ8_PSED2|nr:uncharacterized protein VC83_08821 [Pseudogymnoascus destructans]ELR02514.1 hypothetical protein GMDG_01040 [Pseudogymnoascus destructans 20631-21]OAF54662.1 hypothetical protein VC83_08821 [Pseudogymnoascus destructans]
MAPDKPLPFSSEFKTAEEYVDSLLDFATTSTLFQTLCGGVHILDFFTRKPGLYESVIPEEWHSWLSNCSSMELLDALIRDDLDNVSGPSPSLIKYIKDIRKHSLQRQYAPRKLKQSKLPRNVAVGMVPKKIHEVTNFADYVDRLAEDVAVQTNKNITHYIDFGSGQNYLGRALANPPYNKHIIAVEGREINITGAKNMDIFTSLAEREVVMRNKKIYRQQMDDDMSQDTQKEKEERIAAKSQTISTENGADFRPYRDLATIYTSGEGQGSIQYVEQRLNHGDLSEVIPQIDHVEVESNLAASVAALGLDDGSNHQRQCGGGIVKKSLMTISIHSCGNLSHHGIRSLLLNPSVNAVAIVGCCYNLLTERLGPPTFKNPILRPNLQAVNARTARESATFDPHGYPMSERVGTHNGDGIRLNITARMMAVQAPQNWTEKESDAFFTRHYYRALLQKVFLDTGVVGAAPPPHDSGDAGSESPKTDRTDPVIIGSLRKGCYVSFVDYVKGAVEKLTRDPVRGKEIAEKMGTLTDEDIEVYAKKYGPRKKELSIMWSLMAFSAGVVESLIVTDRWLFLREHPKLVKDCWVEAVFDYKQSPRNLVVVGIKR